MPWPDSLAAQAKCYVDQLEESWMAPHQAVMKNHDEADRLREQAAFGVFLLNRVRSLRPADTFEAALGIYRAYISWHTQTAKLIAQIESSELQDFSVEGADKLRSAYESVDAMIGVFQSRCETLLGFIDGRGISWEDFANEL